MALREWKYTGSNPMSFGLRHHPSGRGRDVILQPDGTVWFDFGDDADDAPRTPWLVATGATEAPADAESLATPAPKPITELAHPGRLLAPDPEPSA